MSGIELLDGVLIVERNPNDLDDLALQFSDILDDLFRSIRDDDYHPSRSTPRTSDRR